MAVGGQILALIHHSLRGLRALDRYHRLFQIAKFDNDWKNGQTLSTGDTRPLPGTRTAVAEELIVRLVLLVT